MRERDRERGGRERERKIKYDGLLFDEENNSVVRSYGIYEYCGVVSLWGCWVCGGVGVLRDDIFKSVDLAMNKRYPLFEASLWLEDIDTSNVVSTIEQDKGHS